MYEKLCMFKFNIAKLALHVVTSANIRVIINYLYLDRIKIIYYFQHLKSINKW